MRITGVTWSIFRMYFISNLANLNNTDVQLLQVPIYYCTQTPLVTTLIALNIPYCIKRQITFPYFFLHIYQKKSVSVPYFMMCISNFFNC